MYDSVPVGATTRDGIRIALFREGANMPWFHIAIALVLAAAAWWLVHTRISLPHQIRTVVDIVVVLIFVGIMLWLINTYVPMAPSIKAILNIVVVIATCVFILQAVGLWGRVVGLWYSALHRNRHPLGEGTPRNQ